MTAVTRRWLPLVGGILPPVPPYADVVLVDVVVARHRYMRCMGCNAPVYGGQTPPGAVLFVCFGCGAMADMRRVP